MEGNLIFTTLTIIGALGFFIYGMKIMSEGIQKVAGSRLRDILGAMTSNRISGVFTGFIITTIIQSSSATTVMLVSFVNAGLLSLRQAIGVIMGANIGTTATAWLIALLGFSKISLSDYSLPILAIGVPLLFLKGEKTKSLGEFLIGFGLLFLGLDALKDSIQALNLDENRTFINFVTDLGNYGFFSTLIFVLIGSLLTIIVQSSTAAMALTLTFIGHGLPFEHAAAIILGENIGTTITANIAAIVGNIHAKRAALAHTFFNISGIIWMLIVFDWFFVDLTKDVFDSIQQKEWAEGMIKEEEDVERYSLALFHTAFNVINTFIMIWFVNFIEKMVVRFVKGSADIEDTFRLEYIGDGTIRTPELALLEARKEVANFGKITGRLSGFVQQLLVEHNEKERDHLLKKIKKYEEITDRIELEVANYLLKVSEGNISEEASIKVRSMLSIVNDLETIGDIFYQISKSLERKIERKLYFTPDQRNNLQEMLKLIDEAFEIMIDNLHLDTMVVDMEGAIKVENKINDFRNNLRSTHLESIKKGEYHVKSGMIYNELFHALEKVGDHVMNVSEDANEINNELKKK